MTGEDKSGNIEKDRRSRGRVANESTGIKYVEDRDYKAYVDGKITEDDLMAIASAKAMFNAGGYYYNDCR